MRALRVWGALAVCALTAAAPGALAADEYPPQLGADAGTLGRIRLIFTLTPPGTVVRFSERTGAVARPLGSATTLSNGLAILDPATTWRCDVLQRRFEAVATTPDGRTYSGQFELRTPPCRDRLSVSIPARAALGRQVKLALDDRWTLGALPTRVCVRAATGRRRCQAVDLAAGATSARVPMRFHRPGRWTVEVRFAGFRELREVLVGRGGRTGAAAADGRPVVLTTGDSTIQGIDSFLSTGLGAGARVVSAFRIGTGISQDANPNWVQRARDQATRLHPRVTVISLGANEGFPERVGAWTVACCGEPWIAEYARRQRAIMRSFERGGRGLVLWLRLPVPSGARRAEIAAAITEATTRAATGLARTVLVPLDAVISPGGRFTPTLRVRGRLVRVREPDGVHLSVAGTSIAADVVLATLRARPDALAR